MPLREPSSSIALLHRSLSRRFPVRSSTCTLCSPSHILAVVVWAPPIDDDDPLPLLRPYSKRPGGCHTFTAPTPLYAPRRRQNTPHWNICADTVHRRERKEKISLVLVLDSRTVPTTVHLGPASRNSFQACQRPRRHESLVPIEPLPSVPSQSTFKDHNRASLTCGTTPKETRTAFLSRKDETRIGLRSPSVFTYLVYRLVKHCTPRHTGDNQHVYPARSGVAHSCACVLSCACTWS